MNKAILHSICGPVNANSFRRVARCQGLAHGLWKTAGSSAVTHSQHVEDFIERSFVFLFHAGQVAVPLLQAPELQAIVHADDDDFLFDA